MSFIDLGKEYETVQESKPMPEGLCFLRVQDVEHVEKKNYLKVLLVADDAEALAEELGYPPAPVMHILSLPAADDDEKDVAAGREAGTTRRFKILNIKRFNTHFNIPMDGTSFAPEDIHGKVARTAVRHEDYQGRPQARLALPNLED